MPNEGSFLDSEEFKLGEVEWDNDDCGAFWSAPFFDRQTERQAGITGTYYDVDESGQRPLKEDQEAELRSFVASR